ncbi:MAG: CheR family methyltransferase [Bryobacteraceae bacterium]
MNPPLEVLETSAGGLTLTAAEFELIRNLARERFGLDLRQGKEELVKARLGRLIRQGRFSSFRSYYDYVVSDRTGEALVGMIDALTTNHTSFRREPAHFEYLVEHLLPAWRNRSYLRIWSAACASGEEPYTLACTLLEHLPPSSSRRIHILATDISTRALNTAERGIYPAERLRDLPPGWLPKFFLRGQGSFEGQMKVKPEVRRLVEFGRLNLIEPFQHAEPFALIFCRNVMIYFDRPVRQMVVEHVTSWLEPGGYLFVGHAESLAGLKTGLTYVRPAVYRKPDPGEALARSQRGRR